MTTSQLLKELGLAVGKPRKVVILNRVPALLYRWWVRAVSPRSHPALVQLVVEQMRYDTLADHGPLQRYVQEGAVSLQSVMTPGEDTGTGGSPRDVFRGADDA